MVRCDQHPAKLHFWLRHLATQAYTRVGPAAGPARQRLLDVMNTPGMVAVNMPERFSLTGSIPESLSLTMRTHLRAHLPESMMKTGLARGSRPP